MSSHFDTRFVKRDTEQQFCLELLAKDNPWILHLSGIGGNGKSVFLEELGDHLREAHVGVSSLNLALQSIRSDPLSVLNQLSEDVALDCSETTVDNFEQELARGRAETLQASSTILIYQQLIVSAGASAQDNSQDLTIIDEAKKKREIARAMVVKAFYKQLSSMNLEHLVIMLDSYERFSEMENREPESLEVRDWLINELIPEIRKRLHAQQKRFSLIIASSIPLDFQNMPWQPQIYNLDKLDRVGVDTHFEQLGILDPQLRKDIYDRMTYGHACCIGIVSQILQEHQSSNALTFVELENLFKPRAFSSFVAKYIKREPAPNEDREEHPHKKFHTFIHYSVLLRRFNLPLLQAVFSNLFADATIPLLFQKLTYYPFVQPKDNSCYTYIDLVREIVCEYVQTQEPENWLLYHQKAIKYLEHRKDQVTEEMRLALYYHYFASDQEQGIRIWTEAISTAYTSNNDTYVGLLLEVADDRTLHLGSQARAEREYWRAGYYGRQNRWVEALASYEQSFSFFHQGSDQQRATDVQREIDAVKQRIGGQ